ncbi:MAG: DUF4250 domain-containing protein [Eubacteriales bacterium]
MIPKDPVMLLSYLNVKLRDEYDSLGQLCEDLQIEEQEIVKAMCQIDYSYDQEHNQFK